MPDSTQFPVPWPLVCRSADPQKGVRISVPYYWRMEDPT